VQLLLFINLQLTEKFVCACSVLWWSYGKVCSTLFHAWVYAAAARGKIGMKGQSKLMNMGLVET